MDPQNSILPDLLPQNVRVLVVDDEEAVRRNVQAGLEDIDYVVQTAGDGKEGLQHFNENAVDIVLTDLRMPNMGGLELIAAIRDKKPYIPVIVLSGTGAINDAIEAIRLGAWDYLIKPVEHPNEIDIAIRRNLVRSRLMIENQRYQNHLEQLVEEKTHQLREYGIRMVKSREEERLHISRGIHDEVGQLVSSIRTNLTWMRQRIAEIPSEEGTLLGRIDEMTDHLKMAAESIRRICADLRPPQLDNLGFEAALEWLVQQFQKSTGIPCKLDYALSADPENLECSIALYRILQESLTNVSKHSQASAVAIEFYEDQGDLVMLFRDNGKGIDLTHPPTSGSFGLMGIKERAIALGGNFEISGKPGEGTTIEVKIPLQTNAPSLKSNVTS